MFNPIVFFEAGRQREAPMVFTIDTSLGSQPNVFVLPIRNSYCDFRVDWGDGSTSRIIDATQPDLSHVYTVPGVYTIKIKGYMPGLYFFQSSSAVKVTELKAWGKTHLSDNQNNAFRGCINMTADNCVDIPDVIVTNINASFYDCRKIKTIGNFQNWKTNLNNLGGSFLRAGLFNDGIHHLATNGVSSFEEFLYGCEAFDKPLNNLDLSNATTTYRMLYGCKKFNQPLFALNVRNVIDMREMFQNALLFDQDISGWEFNKNVRLNNFMTGKTSANYKSVHYDNLLIKWAATFIGTGRTQKDKNIGMGSIKYSSAASAARAALIADGWTITDGGQI